MKTPDPDPIFWQNFNLKTLKSGSDSTPSPFVDHLCCRILEESKECYSR